MMSIVELEKLMSPKPIEAIASPNFAFLAKHDALLVRYGAQAGRYVFEDPNTALIKLRQFSEVLAKLAAAQVGVYVANENGLNASVSNWKPKQSSIAKPLTAVNSKHKADSLG
jgi:hypothetical protein